MQTSTDYYGSHFPYSFLNANHNGWLKDLVSRNVFKHYYLKSIANAAPCSILTKCIHIQYLQSRVFSH